MTRRSLVPALGGAALLLCALSSCAPEQGEAGSVRMQLTLPQGVACAAPPGNIKAQAWVTGMNNPYDLVVSSSGEVSGELEGVTARIDRTVTLDYFILDNLTSPPTGVSNPYRLLLAQAYKKVALTEPEDDRVEVVFTDSDFVELGECLDMTNYDEQTGESNNTVDYFVVGASPCDVDADTVSNLEELCTSPTATDPYDPNDP